MHARRAVPGRVCGNDQLTGRSHRGRVVTGSPSSCACSSEVLYCYVGMQPASCGACCTLFRTCLCMELLGCQFYDVWVCVCPDLLWDLLGCWDGECAVKCVVACPASVSRTHGWGGSPSAALLCCGPAAVLQRSGLCWSCSCNSALVGHLLTHNPASFTLLGRSTALLQVLDMHRCVCCSHQSISLCTPLVPEAVWPAQDVWRDGFGQVNQPGWH